MSIRIVRQENLKFTPTLQDKSVSLVYIDPPFNTGSTRTLKSLKTKQSATGDRTGFGGRKYSTEVEGAQSYDDRYDDYMGFISPRLAECRRVLKDDGSLFVHLDPRESHYVKVELDRLFGRECFMNEIVWAYDYGGRSKTRWSAKHDVILWYVRDPRSYTYNFDAIDRVPYMAPSLVGPEKAERGKTPTDVWWHTIVPTSGKERTGYPTQKPVGLLRRIVAVHSNPGDELLDIFAGSGTLGDAAGVVGGRSTTLVDESDAAVDVMEKRFEGRFSFTVERP